MTTPTKPSDAEFLAEMKALAKEAMKQVETYGASAPLLKFAKISLSAIPRLIGMVEAEKKRADDSDAALAMANSLYAESELHVIHEEKAATERNAEIALRICIERNDAQDERDAALAEVARLRAALIPIVDEFSCTIEQYNKIGPDFTHKDGTEVFMVQTVLDREPLIVAARAALASKE